MSFTNLKLKLLPFPLLVSNRLELVPLSIVDIDGIFELRSDPAVLKHIDRPLIETREEAGLFINKIIKGVNSGQWCYWKIQLKGTQELLGTICLWMFSKDENSCDVGYELRRKAWRFGYMQDALDAVTRYGFNDLELKKIGAYTAEKNAASTQLLEKCGFELGGRDGEDLIYVKTSTALHPC